MALHLHYCSGRSYAFVAIVFLLVIYVLSGIYINHKYKSLSSFVRDTTAEMKANGSQDVLYGHYTITMKTTEKAKQIRYDPEAVPEFTDELDVADLCAWGQEPKETWNRHYQSVFHTYNVALASKSYPELECNATFKLTLTENMDVVSNYHFNSSDKYLQELLLNKEGIEELSKPVAKPRKYPVFVTAASSNDYLESQGLIQAYHKLLKVHPDLELIYYDLGLFDEQRRKLKKYCRCEVRRFDFGKYPSYVALFHGYAWKPIIIQTVLKEYDFVMFMDASVRFSGYLLDEISLLSRQRGIQIRPGRGAVCQRTLQFTFEFLHETPCLFNFPDVPTGLVSISRNRFTLEYILKPWVLCALSYGCMINNDSYKTWNRLCSGRVKYHDCHRHEQSVLGILVSRLFHKYRNLLVYEGT